MKRSIMKKLGMKERKYVLCLMVAGFAALTTGFTSRADGITEVNVPAVETATIEETATEINDKTITVEKAQTNEEISGATDMEEIKQILVPPTAEFTPQNIVETENGGRSFSAVMSMEATAYLPTDGSAEGVTAMGIPASYGVVAVDPDVIPLGSRVYIPGYGEAIAADTGGAIYGYKIDLCMENYYEAMDFGRRNITVYVLD